MKRRVVVTTVWWMCAGAFGSFLVKVGPPRHRQKSLVQPATVVDEEGELVQRLSTAPRRLVGPMVLKEVLEAKRPLRKVWSYNTLIGVCGRSGNRELARRLFEAIPDAGLERNDYTYSTFINTLSGSDWRMAMAFAERSSSPYVTNAALKVLKRARRPKEAVALLSRAPTDAASYTTAMGLVDGSTAVELLQAMGEAGIEPDGRAYAAAVAACGREPRLPELAVRVYRTIPADRMTDYATSAVIAAARARDARRIFAGLDNPSDYCRTAVIAACGREGPWRGALKYVCADSSESVIRAAIAACERGACDQAALAAARLLKHLRLRERGPIELATANAAIAALGAGGRCEAALTVFNELRKGTSLCLAEPDVLSFSSAVAACAERARWRDALLLLADMRLAKMEVPASAVGAALVACQRGGAGPQAASVLRAARRRRVELDVSCYDAAILAQAQTQTWKTAIALFREVRRASKLEPSPRTYVALLEVLYASRQHRRADIVYYAARSRGSLSHAHPEGANTVDFHEFSRATAACALRAALREANPAQDLEIVVGRGRHTRAGRDPVLADFVTATLADECDLEAAPRADNPGRLVVSSADLQSWRARVRVIPPAAWRIATNAPLLAHPALLLTPTKNVAVGEDHVVDEGY